MKIKNIRKSREAGYFPASSGQTQIWTADQLYPGTGANNIVLRSILPQDADLKILEAAINEIASNHRVLRVNFIWRGQELRQSINHKNIKLERMNCGRGSHILEKAVAEIADRAFDLENDPLFRAVVLCQDSTRYLLSVFYHGIFDGQSIVIFNRLLEEAYANIKRSGKSELLKPQPDFLDLIKRPTKTGDGGRDYWIKKLSGDLPRLDLPAARLQPPVLDPGFKIREADIGAAEWRRIRRYAGSNKTTIFSFLFAVYALALYRISGQNEIWIGMPYSLRTEEIESRILGMMANYLPVRFRFHPAMDFSDYMLAVKTELAACYKYGKSDLSLIAKEIRSVRQAGRHPFFDAFFQMYQYLPRTPGLSLDYVPLDKGHYELHAIAIDQGDSAKLKIIYNDQLYPEDMAAKWVDLFMRLLSSCMDEKGESIADLDILSRKDRAVYRKFNEISRRKTETPDLCRDISEQCALQAERSAIVYKDQDHSLACLESASSRLASRLKEQGIERGQPVGIYMPASPLCLVSVLAILKTGAYFVPLDFYAPKKDLCQLIRQSGIRIVVSGRKLASDHFPVPEIAIDERWCKPGFRAHPIRLRPDESVYLMHTSGSTGRPKGVLVKYSSLNNFYQGFCQAIDWILPGKILGLSPMTFDISLVETLIAIARGWQIIWADEEERRDNALIAQLIEKHRIDILQITPSRLQTILDHPDHRQSLAGLKLIMIGGEEMPQSLLDNIRRSTKARIFNMYGPIEATIWAAASDLTREANVHLGKPLLNNQIYILDGNERILPPGAIGQIAIAGAGLAAGYLSDADNQAGKFKSCPFIRGCRIYLTGDQGMIDDSCHLHFRGRMDSQVKVAGKRIETRGIERAIENVPEVEAAAVVLNRSLPEPVLSAFYVSKNLIDPERIKYYLAEKLAEPVLPKAFIRVEKMPVNSHGKLDRWKLSDYKLSCARHSDRPDPMSADKMGQVILRVYRQAVAPNRMEPEDGFFSQGGDSLGAIRLAAKLSAALRKDIPVKLIFKYDTPKKLYDHLAAKTVDDNARIAAKHLVKEYPEYYNCKYADIPEYLRLLRPDIAVYRSLLPAWDLQCLPTYVKLPLGSRKILEAPFQTAGLPDALARWGLRYEIKKLGSEKSARRFWSKNGRKAHLLLGSPFHLPFTQIYHSPDYYSEQRSLDQLFRMNISIVQNQQGVNWIQAINLGYAGPIEDDDFYGYWGAASAAGQKQEKPVYRWMEIRNAGSVKPHDQLMLAEALKLNIFNYFSGSDPDQDGVYTGRSSWPAWISDLQASAALRPGSIADISAIDMLKRMSRPLLFLRDLLSDMGIVEKFPEINGIISGMKTLYDSSLSRAKKNGIDYRYRISLLPEPGMYGHNFLSARSKLAISRRLIILNEEMERLFRRLDKI